jgi:subtilisin family serine protease
MNRLIKLGLICVWLSCHPVIFGAVTIAYRPDQILIQPKIGVSHAMLSAFHTAQGARMLREFPAVGGSQVITVPAGETVPGLIAQYQRSGLVNFAEPDYLVYADATTPNDPKFLDGTLWALNNYGQNNGTPHADIDAIDGWDVLTSASNIVVAVLDSGIRATHEDLAANMWVNPVDGGHGFNAFTGTNNPSDDSSSHGTMVAGVLGAVGNNGKGVTGVAWRVQMMACKCLSNGTGSDSTVLACIDYARTNGAQIINASFDAPTVSLALSNAIVATRDAGIIWVASAGNSGTNIEIVPSYPSCYGIDNVVSVAYTTRTDALGQFSNYGATHVALAAPGDQIFTTFAATDSYYYPPLNTINLAGTSFAAPYVSGALALMLAKYPTENYHQIIQRLLAATDPLPSLAGKCLTGGRLNLGKALNPPIYLSAAKSLIIPDAFSLHLATGANRQCVIQISSDLTAWTSVYTNTTSTNGTFDYSIIMNVPTRYFRAVAPL